MSDVVKPLPTVTVCPTPTEIDPSRRDIRVRVAAHEAVLAGRLTSCARILKTLVKVGVLDATVFAGAIDRRKGQRESRAIKHLTIHWIHGEHAAGISQGRRQRKS